MNRMDFENLALAQLDAVGEKLGGLEDLTRLTRGNEKEIARLCDSLVGLEGFEALGENVREGRQEVTGIAARRGLRTGSESAEPTRSAVQSSASGHSGHRGDFGVQMRAPSSISAWLKSPARARSIVLTTNARIAF